VASFGVLVKLDALLSAETPPALLSDLETSRVGYSFLEYVLFRFLVNQLVLVLCCFCGFGVELLLR
jgi:hypothetical protein